MTRALTSPELALLRLDVQFTKLYLAVYKPNTVYTALLNGVPASNDQVYQITFDNGSGTLGDVTAGMTLYVGTSAGAYDLGMCRIRKAPIAGTFYIGLTSEIEWQDNAYLTVVDDFELWAKHATISDEALSMDVDVAYSDQHTNFNPVPIMGPHAVVWLNDATVDVEFDASDSWVFDSTISGYSWSAPGSDSISGNTTATPTVTYDAPGRYRVYCTVTAANGKTTTGVRHIFVYDRDENQPGTVFQLAQCYADYDAGGWMFDMEMQAEASLSDIHDRALVMLFAEDWYGTTKQSIGPVENRENIVCVGRVVGESIRWDREAGRVHFTVQGMQYWLGKIKAFPVEIYFANNTPDSWSVLPSMTVDRALWHILYWHSTAIETMDFYPTEDTRYLPEGKTLASNIWGQLQDLATSRLLATNGVDHLGRLFVSIDPQMVQEADRDWAIVMELTADDWAEGLDLQRVTVNDVSLITLSSQQCDASGAVSVLYSLSPGHVPRRFGEPLQIDRLLASTQAYSNSLAGLALGWHTNPYPEIPVSLAQNNRMIDLFPRQFCSLVITEQNTPREITFDGNLIPRRISLLFDGDSGFMHPELNFEAETFEMVNTNGDIPDVDDTSIPPFPTINFPDLPALDPLYPGDISAEDGGPPIVAILDDAQGILYSSTFDESVPTWQFWNYGIDSADKSGLAKFFMVPSGRWYAAVYDSVKRAYDTIYSAAALGGKWEVIVNQDTIDTWISTTGGKIHNIGWNPNKPDEVALIVNGPYPTKRFMTGNHAGFTQLSTYSNTQGDWVGNLTYGAGKWVADGIRADNEWIDIFDESGTLIAWSGDLGQGYMTPTYRAGTSPVLLKYKPGVTGVAGLMRSEDNFATYDVIDLSPEYFDTQLALAYDGIFMFGQWYPVAAYRGRSSDGGYSWDGSFFTAGGALVYAYCGGAGTGSRWVLARGVVRFSPDFGTTWLEKEGNLPYLIPVSMTIIQIVIPGYINT